MNVRLLLACVLPLAVGVPARADGDVEWARRATQGAVTLTANPLTPASRTSFYIGRGFSATAIRPYAQACGFSVGMQNGGAKTLTTRLVDWHAVGSDGKRIALRLPREWDAAWERAGVAPAARIAFKWAQFQAESVLEPGDWIMGMATLEKAPVESFRVVARYRDEKGDHEIAIGKLACTRD